MITQFDNPKFYDKKVQELNEKLDLLNWIENIYPIVQTGFFDGVTFPEVYNNNGSKKNTRVYPKGNSISFFKVEGEINGVDRDDDDMHFIVPLSLTVWADLKKVYPYKEYNYRSELISDVMTVLRSNSCYDITLQLDNVFEGYTDLEKENNQNTMLPYTAFKINFSCTLTTC